MNNLEKKYYHLKELSPIVNLKYRQLIEKIKVVSRKYKDREDLIYKKSNKWFIHYSLIKEFQRIRKPIDYKLFITIGSKNRFEREYWKYIIFQLNRKLKKIDPSARVKYVIELKDNYYHLHFKTTFGLLKQLRRLIKNDELTNDNNDMNVVIINVWDLKGLTDYFKKQFKPVLLK